MVYFIEAVGAGLVKIGFTDGDPAERLRQLQTGSAHPLRLRATIRGDMETEKATHRRFAHLRTGGEWFTLAVEVEVFMLVCTLIHPELDILYRRFDELVGRVDDLASRSDRHHDDIALLMTHCTDIRKTLDEAQRKSQQIDAGGV